MTGSADAFQDRLNDYLDSELSPREVRTLESHLKECEDCQQALRELREIVRAARQLPAVEPSPTVWDSIAANLDARGVPGSDHGQSFNRLHAGTGGRRSLRTSIHSALALAATVILGVALWTVLRPTPEPPPPTDSAALANMVTDELRAAESHYDKAITGLEQIIAQNGGVLPPELASVLNQNLDLIEGAIAESRAAMSSEPDSTVAQESLLDALRKKVALLQNTILLINEIRKGQGENALDLIDEMRKTTAPANPI